MAFDFKKDFRRAAMYLTIYARRLQLADDQWRSASALQGNAGSIFLQTESFTEELLDDMTAELEVTDRLAKEEGKQFLAQEECEQQFLRALNNVKDFIGESPDPSVAEEVKPLLEIVGSLAKEDGEFNDLVANDELFDLVTDIHRSLKRLMKRIEREPRGERIRPLR